MKHGVAFEAAARLDWPAALEVVQQVGAERRICALAPLDDRLHVCIFTVRGDARRIMSLRRANRRELRAWRTAFGEA